METLAKFSYGKKAIVRFALVPRFKLHRVLLSGQFSIRMYFSAPMLIFGQTLNGLPKTATTPVKASTVTTISREIIVNHYPNNGLSLLLVLQYLATKAIENTMMMTTGQQTRMTGVEISVENLADSLNRNVMSDRGR